MPVIPDLYQGIKYLRVNRRDLNELFVGDDISSATTIIVHHSNGVFEYLIKNIYVDSISPTAYFVEVSTTTSAYPTDTTNAVTLIQPGKGVSIDYNTFNAVLNNATTGKPSNRYVEVDRPTISDLPSNISSIVKSTAVPAEVCGYLRDSKGMSNSRYKGCKLSAQIPNEFTKGDAAYNSLSTIDRKTSYFGTFDSIQETSDLGGVYQMRLPYVVNADGDVLSTIDTKELYYDVPDIFESDHSVVTSIRTPSEYEPTDPDLLQKQSKFTGTFPIYKGGYDVTTIVNTTSGSWNEQNSVLNVKRGQFFSKISFGDGTGVGFYEVDASLSGSEENRIKVNTSVSNTKIVPFLSSSVDDELRFRDGDHEYVLSGPAETSLQFVSEVLLAYDRDGTGWKEDMVTTVSLETTTDDWVTTTVVKSITIPRFWNRYDIDYSGVPAGVTILGYRKIDGITGIYLGVSLNTGFIDFASNAGSTTDTKMRTRVTYDTTGNDDCFIHPYFDFRDKNGLSLKQGVAGTGAASAAGAAGALGVAALSGVSFGLSTLGSALAVLAGPATLGAALVGGAAIALINWRRADGQISYSDTNNNYIRVTYPTQLEGATLYSGFKVSQQVLPPIEVDINSTPPFRLHAEGPYSTTRTRLYGNSPQNSFLSVEDDLSKAFGYIQSSTESELVGFKDITTEFQFLPGDELRFEGDENQVHTIVQVYPVNKSLPEGQNAHSKMVLEVSPPIHGATYVKNFTLRRYVKDPSCILLRREPSIKYLIKKQLGIAGPPRLVSSSTNLKGTVSPEYVTDALTENFPKYKQDLVAKRII